eukprot:SM000039S14455  [mRNA]  locus=s39:196198:200057:- [translate_table: standard]
MVQPGPDSLRHCAAGRGGRRRRGPVLALQSDVVLGLESGLRPRRSGWNIGNLVKNLASADIVKEIASGDLVHKIANNDIVRKIASKSEEVLKDYQRDLQEFGEGLKKETGVVVDVTTHSFHDLPLQLEKGGHAAQDSFVEVSHTMEELGATIWKSTAVILNQVKDVVASVDEESPLSAKLKGATSLSAASLSRGKYSRYEAQVSAMQRDSSTYCDEPEDEDDFSAWKSSFKLEERNKDIETILKENAFMQELQLRIVPLIVEHDTFWTRYFYRLHKLQQAEDARAELVKRATTSDEEELSWDVDEDTDESKAMAAVPTDDGKQAVLPTEGDGQGALASTDEAPKERDASDREATSVPDSKPGPAEAPRSTNTRAATSKAESPEEDAASNGSAVSTASGDWMVVQQDKDGSPKAIADSSKAADEKLPPVRPEADTGSSTAAPQAEDEVKATAPAPPFNVKGKAPIHREGEEGDWGEWE